MGDDQDRRAGLRERRNRAEERRDFGWCERGRRFVEQQHARTAFEFAQQFDTLLHPDRQGLHDRIGIHLEPVLGRERPHPFARRDAIDAPAALGLAPEQHVFPHVQALDELEVLVHEAHDGFRFNRAFIGDHRAEGDGGQRRFARAVFTDQRVNLAGLQLEIDAVDGLHGTEALTNPAQRENRLAHSVTGLNVASSSRVVGGTILRAMIALRSTSSS